MSIYRINGTTYDLAKHDGDTSALNHLLKSLQASKTTRAFCLCNPPAYLPMHVSRRGDNYFLVKDAGTGDRHHRLCRHHSITATEAACMGYSKDAIETDEDDNIKVSLLCGLKTGSKLGASVSTQIRHGGASVTVTNRITLLGLLNLIWEKESLNVYTPGKDASDIWARVRQCARSIQPRGIRGLDFGLETMLLIQKNPETNNQARRNFMKVGEGITKKRNVFFICRLDAGIYIKPDEKGQYDFRSIFEINLKIRDKSVIDRFKTSFPLSMNDKDIGQRDSDLILFGMAKTGVINDNQYSSIEMLVAMPVVHGYIPFDSGYERQLAEVLISDGRSFEKPLRYDAKEPVFPDFILMDSTPRMAIEVYGMNSTAYSLRKDEKRMIYRNAGYRYSCWEWDVTKEKSLHAHLQMNPLPN